MWFQNPWQRVYTRRDCRGCFWRYGPSNLQCRAKDWIGPRYCCSGGTATSRGWRNTRGPRDWRGHCSRGRQQPEASGTQEGQETGEANVPEERQHPEAGGTQEKRWELPKKLLANKAVWNIQNKDDMCLYWSIRTATKLRTLQVECRCGRGEDCIWQRI